VVGIKAIKRIDPVSLAKVTGVVAGTFTFIFATAVTLIVSFIPGMMPFVGVQVGFSYILTETLISLIGGFVFAIIIAYLYNLFAPKLGYVMIDI